MALNQTWDLDVIFTGGSQSESFAQFLRTMSADLQQFAQGIQAVPADADHLAKWVNLLTTYGDLDARFTEAMAFVECLTSQDEDDLQAIALESRINQFQASFSNALHELDAKLLAFDEATWKQLLADPTVATFAEAIIERRALAADKLDVARENLISDLSVDGYHAWGAMYGSLVSRIRIPVERDGKTVQMSAGQAFNQLNDPNRDFRESLFETWEQAWGENEGLFAQTLNHLAGFRLAAYEARGWSNVLKEPLTINRMTEGTLNTMWSVITKNKAPFATYLERKAKLYGVDKPTWADVDAPVGSVHRTFTYDEARDFIVKHFATFDPNLADFADRAFRERWIEVEDRPGKRPGGFCTSFPLKGQSRIFMTFSGTLSNVATLAHELGHAYHQYVMNGVPQLLTGYAMNVAETASTFTEMIVADAALKESASKEERVYLLADKLERSVAFYMNIHCRFLFESRFYEARKQGMVDAQSLNQLMVEAQKEAYADSLATYHPHFWAAKLHFHITQVPFYNFPYTFGYMFSTGIYARALQEGPSFAQNYVELLRDTGRMQVEELAHRHLGVDLTQEEFWQDAIDLGIADVKEFLALTE